MVYFGISWDNFGILLGDLLLCFDVAVAHWYTSWRSASLLFIVYELLVSVAAAIALETDSVIKERIGLAQGLTVISWCTFPVVYLFPMRGINASTAVVSIQTDYCAYDIISKCGVESWFA